MDRRRTASIFGLWLVSLLAFSCGPAAERVKERSYAEVETRLRPIALPLAKSQPGDWLAEHKEDGQTFAAYLRAKPVRKSAGQGTIYICLLGDFTPEQTKVLATTQQYLEIFYQVPVKVHHKMAVKDLPERARRIHPTWGGEQILSTYVLDEVLKPDRPKDALAYLAFTSSDLFPEPSWNFVFGQASLRDRTGVWSIHRNGDPAKGEKEYQLCLRRTLHTASHETGHILTIQHCTAFDCNMNGVNSQDEGDRKPLTLCPVCLRKVCWNLQVDPAEYLGQLENFCRENKLAVEADWYCQAAAALAGR
jgi:archaemetzincin